MSYNELDSRLKSASTDTVIFVIIALLVISSGVCGFGWGKYRADRWYAEHWHPNVRLDDVVDKSKMNKVFVGMQPSGVNDVTLIGHGITVVNASHVFVLQCSEEAMGDFVSLNTQQMFVCADPPKFKWLPVVGKRVVLQ